MFDSARYIEFPPRSILSLQDHRQSRNPGQIPICNAVLCFPHNNIAGIHLYDECARANAPSVCHKMLSIFMTVRASLFTDHRMSSLPMRAKHKHFLESRLFDSSPNVSYFFFFDLMVVNTWCGDVVQLLSNKVLLPAEIRDSNIFLYSSTIPSFGLHWLWVNPKYTWPRNDVGSPRSTCVIHFFHVGSRFLVPSSQVDVIHVYRQEQTLLTMHK